MLPVSVVIPFCRHDKDQAIRLLGWIAELGKVDAKCYLIGPAECEPASMLTLAYKAFAEAKVWIDAEDIQSDWNNPDITAKKSAAGPNSIFRQVAWNMNLGQLGPWLFLEPDAVPLCKDWLEQLCAEYQTCNMPFMGARVDSTTHPATKNLPLHMSGVAIWPQRVPSLAPAAVQPSDLAFDVMGAEQIVPRAHFTKLIEHSFRAPGFRSMAEVRQRIPAMCVLFHANKDGSLIQLLKGGEVTCATNTSPSLGNQSLAAMTSTKIGSSASKGAETVQPVSAPTCDIFIKTYAKDYEWLVYCLRSIDKFASGFRQVVIVAPDSFAGPPMEIHSLPKTNHPCVSMVVIDQEPGYLHQQVVKLEADKYTDADLILYMDSDCIFTRPVTPRDFLHRDKPIWLMKPMNQARPDEQGTWMPVMEKFFGKPPVNHFMVRHPFICPREVLAEFRQFCKYRHGMDLDTYVFSQADPKNPLALNFSEWQTLGGFCFEHQKDKFSWVWADDAGRPCIHQGWSHGGLKPEHRAEMECIIEGPYSAKDLMEHKTSWPCNESFKEMGSMAEVVALLVKESSASNARLLEALKSALKEQGGEISSAPVKTPPRASSAQHEGFLLAIQTYPGANDGLKRHWPYFEKSGASRIVAIGTTDYLCSAPCEIIPIGANKYIDGAHLPQRLVDTIKWCLTQPEDKYLVCEWDCLFLRPIKPDFKGFCTCKAGGKLPKTKASSFYHNPWAMDRKTAEQLVVALEEIIADGECTGPTASPDVTICLAADNLSLPVNIAHWKQFTRNSLDVPGDLELACEAVKTVDVIHGVKLAKELARIERSIKKEVK